MNSRKYARMDSKRAKKLRSKKISEKNKKGILMNSLKEGKLIYAFFLDIA
tara:strand:+ start:326 stop:475 length:150 start_codon:yes stop_codon:yes gene_type:complete